MINKTLEQMSLFKLFRAIQISTLTITLSRAAAMATLEVFFSLNPTPILNSMNHIRAMRIIMRYLEEESTVISVLIYFSKSILSSICKHYKEECFTSSIQAQFPPPKQCL